MSAMDKSEILHDFEELPPSANGRWRTLSLSCGTSRPPKQKNGKPLCNESFGGIWRNREDMADSSQWVRKIRGEEWGYFITNLTIVDTDILIAIPLTFL
jgi:hypothetical protein